MTEHTSTHQNPGLGWNNSYVYQHTFTECLVEEREREKGKEKEREGEGGQKKGEKRKYPKEKPQFSCILTLEVTFHWFCYILLTRSKFIIPHSRQKNYRT